MAPGNDRPPALRADGVDIPDGDTARQRGRGFATRRGMFGTVAAATPFLLGGWKPASAQPGPATSPSSAPAGQASEDAGRFPGRRYAAPAPSSAFNLRMRRARVHGAELAYYELGEGRPVLFLHGLPTWSYLWRNVMPFVAATGHRAIALDLLGFGRSDRPDGVDLGYAEQVRYLDGVVDVLGLQGLSLVLHDWGGGIGLDHASRHAGNLRGIAYLEAAIAPAWPRPDLASFGPLEPLMRRFRDPVAGQRALMDENLWVERLLPASVLRPLDDAAMAAYREPFPTRESRRAIFELTRSLPIAGEPKDTAAAMARAEAWWRATDMPKLAIYGDPSRLTPEPLVRWALANLRNVEAAFVGRGIHYLQEDEPEAVGRAVAEWLRRLPT